MKIELKNKAKPHLLMPGETISAAIKKYNLYEASKEEVDLLIEVFKEINQEQVFKPGMRVLIPILDRLLDRVFENS